MSRKRWIWDNWFKPRDQWPPYYGPDLAKVKNYITTNINTSAMEKQSKLLNLESSNFWTAIALVIGGFFVGFPEDAASNGVEYIFGLLASVKAIREYFKQYKPKPNVDHAVNSSNFWNYIGVIAVSLVPTIPLELIDSVRDVAVNIIGQNWQGVIVAVFSIATILYNIFVKKPGTASIAIAKN